MQEEFDALDKEYREYICRLRSEWILQNRVHSNDVYEVMRPEEQARVHSRIDQYKRHITPIAEAWWKKRGFRVVWPDDDSMPMKLHKIEVA